MARDRDKMAERILHLTLEILFRLTGEDYTVVKKTSSERCQDPVSEGWGRPLSPITGPPPHPLIHDDINDQKILELAYKMIELLTGEVPIRCQDVAVYFSMEEWEYLEGHKDLYKDIMMEVPQPLTSPVLSSRRTTPERFPGLLPKDCKQEVPNVPQDHQCEDLPHINTTETYVREDERCKEEFPTDNHTVNQEEEGRKARGRGAGRGRGDSVPAAGTGDSSPSFSREQSFMRSFVGDRCTPLLLEEQIEAIVGWMAANASTSISATSSQAQSTGEHPSVSSPPAKLPRQSESPGQEPSLLLFSESLSLETGGQPSSIGEMEEEAVCSDAQQLCLCDSEEAGGPVPPVTTPQYASDDETQVPLSGAYCAAETTQEEQLVAEGSVDDEVLDPPWHEVQEGGGSSSEEEIPRTGQRGRGKTVEPVASTSAPVRSMPLPKAKKGAPKTCSAWSFFDTVADDICLVKCKVCHQKVKRGRNVSNLNTSNMWKHVRTKHAVELQKHTEDLGQPTAAPTTSSAGAVASSSSSHTAGSASSQDRHGRSSGTVVQRPTVIPPAAPRSQSSSHFQASLQPSVAQAWEKRRPFSANHPRAQALNAGIAKLLSLEMLSFRLVETDSFRNLMALAIPQYNVPSRFYFSRQAVPALHKHVEGHIKHALLNAVSSKVHLTTDAWTSHHGQGRYLSLTAHWVNVVEPGTDHASGAGRVLSTPRTAGIQSVRIDSSSYTSSSDSSLQEPSQSTSTWTRERLPVTTDMSSAVAKRQQAVLKLIYLGNRSHTAQELWNAIKQESDVWFVPANLQPGMVVCDNGRNLVAALALGNLTHIPCLAHVLNLVVQSFLRDYPDLDALLHKVRLECAHLRRSSIARSSIAALQRRFRLPEHRIICDLPTRWNSTLHMLERLCEQQPAVMEYQLHQAQRSRTPRRSDFTTTEWATMKDVCQVLRSFEDSTWMASADDALVSMTVPLICLLQQTLQALRDDVVEEVEDEESPIPLASGQSALHGSSQRLRQGTLCEEDEEESMEEEDIGPEEGVTQFSSSQCVERGWGDAERAEITPQVGDGVSWPVGSLQHMADYMLQCLRNDRCIAHILNTADYWVYTLLDPRYRDNLQSLITPLNRERKMREYQDTLVNSIIFSSPSESRAASALQSSSVRRGSGGSSAHRGSRISTSAQGKTGMAQLWHSFVCPPHMSTPSQTAPVSRRQRFSQMVTDYMSCPLTVLPDGSSPFKFWVSKLDTWPELSQYALEVLACPAASVLSERVFSAAGGVLTDRRMRLSSDNVDRLTFLKMNKAWISQEFATPFPD
ncbi:zinc finger BED domain-containing protein 6-like isoform X1 [Ranitomeya variabilis]|uniref:zinc finger BED domain-containing protein 6-like isoform X1 n=1 Tax=Ranitomeya variabilis TaxID=490064 RepID=UPI0040569E4F